MTRQTMTHQADKRRDSHRKMNGWKPGMESIRKASSHLWIADIAETARNIGTPVADQLHCRRVGERD